MQSVMKILNLDFRRPGELPAVEPDVIHVGSNRVALPGSQRKALRSIEHNT
jgi:hypothetical protein